MMTNFFSPERKRSLGNLPTYGIGNVLPGLYIRPVEELHDGVVCVELEAFLATDRNQAQSFRSKPIPAEFLSDIFDDYRQDPEALLLRLFNYTPLTKAPDKPLPGKKSSLNLEDLGL